MMGTMVTIAKDVKIQVEFNPKQVKEYRLIGYANRILPNSAFYDKKADAGEIGAGHRVTAFYEIVPGDATDKEKKKEFRYRAEKVDKDKDEKKVVPAEHADELLYVKLAYKQPNQKKNDESIYLAVPLKKDDVKPMSEDFSFASAVALFGMNLRDSEYRNDAGLDKVLELAEKGKGTDGKGHREEFIKLAQENSDELASANNGGDLGWISKKSVLPKFYAEAAKLRELELSEPFKTDMGWHLVQVIGKRSSNNSLLAAKNRARSILHNKKFNERLELWLKRMRANARIKNHLDKKSNNS